MFRAVPGTLSVPAGPFHTQKRPSCIFTPISSDDLKKKKHLIPHWDDQFCIVPVYNGFVTELVSAPVLGRIFPGEVRRLSSPCEEVELFSQIGQKNSDINKVLTNGQDGCPFP